MRRLGLVLVLVLAVAAAWPRLPAVAADGIDVRSDSAQNRFPDGVQFTIFVSSNAEITSVRLRYRILPDGATVFGRPTCTSGSVVNCNINVGSTAAAFLVPGVQILYSWEIEDAAGAKLETAQKSYTYDDPRFRWDSISDGNVTVFYYSGSEQSARSVLATARETLDKSGVLLATKVDFPVKVWVYATAAEMRPAILSNRRIPPNTNNPTTLGEVVYSDTALVSRDTQPLDIVRHEVTHVVIRAATKGALGDPPAWLDEGTAVYAQTRILPDEQQALDLAIRRNRPLSIFSLTSSTLTQTDTSLFYAQAYSTVKYLIDTYGASKFAQFVGAFKDNGTDDAMRKVYGFDQAGLEDRWRASVGLPALAPAATAAPGSNERSIPTIVPFGAGNQPAAATPQPGASPGVDQTAKPGGGSSNVLVIAIGALTALAAVGILGAGLWVARRAKG